MHLPQIVADIKFRRKSFQQEKDNITFSEDSKKIRSRIQL